MKRYVVVFISLLMLSAVCLCAFGESSFYSKASGDYIILLPDNKTNGDFSKGMGGVVYTDASFSEKAVDSNVLGTGRYANVSGKKYEIIVIGDYDGDGFVLKPDLDRAKKTLTSPLTSERERNIFDADENGKYNSRDYILLKFHSIGIKKLAENYADFEQSQETSASEEESIDPDWVNQCAISFSGNKISVEGNGAVVSGKAVTITAGGEYTVSGNLTDGMIYVNSSEKVKIRLNGANISNSTGPAILFANADKAFITIANGTVNYLSDGSSYSNGKGTIFSEADLEIKGKGTLYINANYKHGIACDNDLSVENGTIIIQKAVKDGIHVKKSIEISGGTLEIKNCGGDAFDCEGTSSLQKGTVSVTGGKITVSNTEGDGINAFGNVSLSGGEVSVSCAQDGIKTDAFVYISGTVSLYVDAGSDGINSAKGINVSSGTAKINATEYTLKSDANISVLGGSLTLEGVREKIYYLGEINIANGTVK